MSRIEQTKANVSAWNNVNGKDEKTVPLLKTKSFKKGYYVTEDMVLHPTDVLTYPDGGEMDYTGGEGCEITVTGATLYARYIPSSNRITLDNAALVVEGLVMGNSKISGDGTVIAGCLKSGTYIPDVEDYETQITPVTLDLDGDCYVYKDVGKHGKYNVKGNMYVGGGVGEDTTLNAELLVVGGEIEKITDLMSAANHKQDFGETVVYEGVGEGNVHRIITLAPEDRDIISQALKMAGGDEEEKNIAKKIFDLDEHQLKSFALEYNEKKCVRAALANVRSWKYDEYYNVKKLEIA